MRKLIGDYIDNENSKDHFYFESNFDKDGINYKGWFCGDIFILLRENISYLDDKQYEIIKTDNNVLKALLLCILDNIGISFYDAQKHKTNLIKIDEYHLFVQLDNTIIPFDICYRLIPKNVRKIWSI